MATGTSMRSDRGPGGPAFVRMRQNGITVSSPPTTAMAMMAAQAMPAKAGSRLSSESVSRLPC